MVPAVLVYDLEPNSSRSTCILGGIQRSKSAGQRGDMTKHPLPLVYPCLTICTPYFPDVGIFTLRSNFDNELAPGRIFASAARDKYSGRMAAEQAIIHSCEHTTPYYSGAMQCCVSQERLDCRQSRLSYRTWNAAGVSASSLQYHCS